MVKILYIWQYNQQWETLTAEGWEFSCYMEYNSQGIPLKVELKKKSV